MCDVLVDFDQFKLVIVFFGMKVMLYEVEGGDYFFVVLKKFGCSNEVVFIEVFDVLVGWIDGLVQCCFILNFG